MATNGFFSRITRLFRPAAAGEAVALPGAPSELGFALAAKAPTLFSVFPRAGEEADAPDEPTQDFGIHLAHAMHFHLKHRGARPLVGLLGAGGAGKSTLFNHLVDAAVSKVDILPHTTKGPVAVAATTADVRGLLHPLGLEEASTPGLRRGDEQRWMLTRQEQPAFPALVLTDLPDLNTRAALDEGTLTASLLPWLDATLVVCSVESFDRTVLDRSLGCLAPLGSRLLLVFNRKGCRGEVADADRQDLEARCSDLGATGPFYFPDLRQVDHMPDDREELAAQLRALGGDPGPLRGTRRRALRDTVTQLGREALARHEARAARAEDVLAAFRASLKGLRSRLELDPTSAMPGDITLKLRDLRGLIGSPVEWLRRVLRGEGVASATAKTFSLESRRKELSGAVEALRDAQPGPYVERLEDHFRMVSSSVARSYRSLVSKEPTLFLESECRQDLVEALFDPHRAAAARGFTSFRDSTVAYLDKLEGRMLGPTSRLERALALGVFMFLMVDFFVPGFSFVTLSGGYLVTRTLGSEFQGLFADHRALREKQRAELERCWDLLAAGLEGHFLRGDRYFGRMDIMERPEREHLRGVLDALVELPLDEEEAP